MNPRVTVVIATYNWSSVLPYSIGSVLDQSFRDFELLVIGDGCTDDSEAVVRAIEDSRVRWINIPRHGHQSGPNNEGIRVARGEFIAYLGHDDLWLPHHLEVLVAALAAGADLAQSVAALVAPDGSSRAVGNVPSATMHRRSMIDVTGGWQNFREIHIDPELALWQRAKDAGLRYASVPRLTAVKFPAAWRRGVYRERPSHEQASWLARIRAEPDLEMRELVKMAMRPEPPRTLEQRIAGLFIKPWRLPGIVWRRIRPKRSGQVIHTMQRFKGVR